MARKQRVSNPEPRAPVVPKQAVPVASSAQGAGTIVTYRAGSTYYYVNYQPHGRYKYAIVQGPATGEKASGVAAAIGAVASGISDLLHSGGGGFGNRIVPGFPLSLFLLGLGLMAVGSYVRRAGIKAPRWLSL